jgi:hypothetical protein
MLKQEFQRLALDVIGSSDHPLPAAKIIHEIGTPNTTGRRYLKQMLEARMLTRNNEGLYAIALPKSISKASKYQVKESLDICATALAHLEPVRGLMVRGYVIALYFPEQRLAVEAAPIVTDDPIDHDLDLQRTRFITRILGCQWIWFNPDEDGFCPGKVINRVLKIVNSAIACEVIQ